MKRLLSVICLFVFFVVASANADSTIRRYAWPPDGEIKISLESIYKAGVGRSSLFVDGIQLWAQDTDLAVAQYLFEVPSYAYGIEVSLRYIAESGTLIKLYIADLEEEDYEDNGFSVVLPAEKDWYKFFVNNLNFSRKVKIEVSVAQGVVDIYYFEINWLSYKPRIEVIHRYREVPLSEEFYIYHYYYERVPLYVYETPYRIIVYDYWWEAPKYTEWYYCYAPTIIKYRPVYRLYRTTPIYYSSYSYRWGRPIVMDCPREDPPVKRVRLEYSSSADVKPAVRFRGRTIERSGANKERLEQHYYSSNFSGNERQQEEAVSKTRRGSMRDLSSQTIKKDVLQKKEERVLTESQQPIRQISARDGQEIRRASSSLRDADIQLAVNQREERQIPQKSRPSRSLENIFSRVVNVKVTTEQSESSQRTNNYVGESSFQKRRVDVDRQQPIQQIQRAPVREYFQPREYSQPSAQPKRELRAPVRDFQPSAQPSVQPSPQRELRREESRQAPARSSSSSEDDEEHKKRRRDR